jgi:hypothetical protein
MPHRSIVANSARLMREFGGQVAVSVAASAVAAAFLAAPEMLLLPGQTAGAQVARQAPEDWISPIAPDGKIAMRLRQAMAADGAEAAPTLLSRASLVMPMSASWPQAAFDEAPVPVVRVRSAEAHPVPATAPATRKAAPAVERSKVAAEAPPPLPIIQARLTTQVAGPVPVSLASATLTADSAPSTLARVGNAMSGAVGSVGAAGIWTLSQASSLLPRL